MPPPLPPRKPPPPLPHRVASINTETPNAPVGRPPVPISSKPINPLFLRPVPVPVPRHEPAPEPEPEEEEAEPAEEEYDEELCIKCRDFSTADHHASLFPRHTVSSLDQLAYDLSLPFDNETDRARVIFTWLHHNIAYDAASFFGGCVRPATETSTLQSGLAVCQGYADLFLGLASRMGLQVYVASGHGKGYGYQPIGLDEAIPPFDSNHAWNVVCLDGTWHCIDACWGAGHLDGTTFVQKFSPEWFTYDQFEFGRRHYPSEPLYQLISDEDGGAVSWEEYISRPEGPQILGDLTNLDYSPHTVEPAFKYIQGGAYANFRVAKTCPHLSTDERDNYCLHMVASLDGTRTIMQLDAEGGWAATAWVPESGQMSLYCTKTIDNRDARGYGNYNFQQAIGKKAMSFAILTVWSIA